MNMSKQVDPASAVIAPESAAPQPSVEDELVRLAIQIEKHQRLADEHDVYARYHRAKADVLGIEFDRLEAKGRKQAGQTVCAATSAA